MPIDLPIISDYIFNTIMAELRRCSGDNMALKT